MLKIYPNLLKIIVSAPPAAHMPRPRLRRSHALHSLPSPPLSSPPLILHTRVVPAGAGRFRDQGRRRYTADYPPSPLPTAVSRQAIKHARRRLIPSSQSSETVIAPKLQQESRRPWYILQYAAGQQKYQYSTDVADHCTARGSEVKTG